MSARNPDIGQVPSRAGSTAPKRTHEPTYMHTTVKRTNSRHEVTRPRKLSSCAKRCSPPSGETDSVHIHPHNVPQTASLNPGLRISQKPASRGTTCGPSLRASPTAHAGIRWNHPSSALSPRHSFRGQGCTLTDVKQLTIWLQQATCRGQPTSCVAFWLAALHSPMGLTTHT
ncbi:unnamed protein product [Periconia digitata]|uniref:Uncharacterized protein n=1 Tax=Periconia digitata TaxID=1303443 RepID=A0A9W4UUU5_9PLEO|nr:unnamed protein product [Periconia digitata]